MDLANQITEQLKILNDQKASSKDPVILKNCDRTIQILKQELLNLQTEIK